MHAEFKLHEVVTKITITKNTPDTLIIRLNEWVKSCPRTIYKP